MPAVKDTSDQAPLSTSGIQTLPTGHSVIPSSVRSDGTTRKEIKVRPGYRPPEDQKKYRNRIVEDHDHISNRGVPGGAEPLHPAPGGIGGAEVNKNAKRREAARRKAAAAAVDEQGAGYNRQTNNSELDNLTNKTSTMQLDSSNTDSDTKTIKSDHGEYSSNTLQPSNTRDSKVVHHLELARKEQATDPATEQEKKARNLRKKLRQARDLKEKRDEGDQLLPEQLAKVTKIQELMRELSKLGYNLDG